MQIKVFITLRHYYIISSYILSDSFSNLLGLPLFICWYFNLCPRDLQEVAYFPFFFFCSVDFVVQSPSHVWLFGTPWTPARQTSLSLTISWSFPKFMFIALVMPSSHLILWHPLLLLPQIFPSIRDLSNESSVRIRWLDVKKLEL